MPEDFSNGYEENAEEFIAVRSTSGTAIVQKWAASLPRGSSVIDIGAGSGHPIMPVLLEAGLSVSAIDASPKMVIAMKHSFPDVEVACEPAELSQLFNRTFDAALAIGLIFLLPEASQGGLIRRVANALNPGGRFLFTAPLQSCEWYDILTDRHSISLGEEKYRQILTATGLSLIDGFEDESGNYYYEAQKLKPD